MSPRPESSRISTTTPHRLTCRYQSYQVTTVIGNPSGRTNPMTAAFGFLRKASTGAGSASTDTVLLQREGRLPPVRQVVDLDRNDPLDPPEAAPVRRDQPRGKSMAGIQGRAAEPRREQKGRGLGGGKPAVIAGARDDADARPPRAGQEAVQAHPRPLLRRVEAACAVE